METRTEKLNELEAQNVSFLLDSVFKSLQGSFTMKYQHYGHRSQPYTMSTPVDVPTRLGKFSQKLTSRWRTTCKQWMIRKGKLIFSKNKPFDRLTNVRGNAGWGHVSSLSKTVWDFNDVNTVIINKTFKNISLGPEKTDHWIKAPAVPAWRPMFDSQDKG